MSTTLQVPNNVPVSWLQRIKDSDMSSDMLMLASVPGQDTETQFMSKYLTFGDLEGKISDDFELAKLRQQMSNLSVGMLVSSDYLAGTLSLDTADPYIMSSLTFVMSSDGQFGPLSCSGYRLSSGINSVFTAVNAAGKELTTIIPQLASKTTSLTSPTTNYITSITDKNGHIQSFGTGNFSDVISQNISTATKSADDGCVISSVTTQAGKVTSVGEVAMTSFASLVFYTNKTSQTHPDYKAFVHWDLSVMKLTEAQLTECKNNNMVIPNCIYLTPES